MNYEKKISELENKVDRYENIFKETLYVLKHKNKYQYVNDEIIKILENELK
jgi:hypothetical protein